MLITYLTILYQASYNYSKIVNNYVNMSIDYFGC
jgi:hypothetical protein